MSDAVEVQLLTFKSGKLLALYPRNFLYSRLLFTFVVFSRFSARVFWSFVHSSVPSQRTSFVPRQDGFRSREFCTANKYASSDCWLKRKELRGVRRAGGAQSEHNVVRTLLFTYSTHFLWNWINPPCRLCESQILLTSKYKIEHIFSFIIN